MSTKKPEKQNFIVNFFDNLKSSQLLMALSLLFLIDLAVPDPIPFVDEIILGILTLVVARWKNRSHEPEPESAPKPPPKNITPPAA